MAIEHASGYCNNCKADRKVERKAPNHILHLLITVVLGIFTFGIGAIIWIIIWIAASIRFGGWMCSTCGSENVEVKYNNTKVAFYIISALIIVIFSTVGKQSSAIVKAIDPTPDQLNKMKQLKQDNYEEKQSFINYVLDNDNALADAVLDKKELHITINSNSSEFSRTTDYARYVCDKIKRTSHRSMLPLKIIVKDNYNQSYYQTNECK